MFFTSLHGSTSQVEQLSRIGQEVAQPFINTRTPIIYTAVLQILTAYSRL